MDWLLQAAKSKTMWFSVMLAVLGVFEQNSGFIRDIVGEANFGMVMMGISAVTAVLRAVTTQPLSAK